MKLEMLMPLLVPRVEETLDFTGLWINSRKICSLERVASRARHAEVVGVITAPVNPRSNVVDVERDKRLGRLRYATVFTTVLRTLPYKTSRAASINGLTAWRGLSRPSPVRY
jgi:hypothetical protein